MRILIFYKVFLIYFLYAIIPFSTVFASEDIHDHQERALNFFNENKNVIPKAFYLRIAMFMSKKSQDKASKLLEDFLSEFKVNCYEEMQVAYILKDVKLLRNVYNSYLERPLIDFFYKNHMYDFIQMSREYVITYDFFSRDKELLFLDSCKFYDNLKDKKHSSL